MTDTSVHPTPTVTATAARPARPGIGLGVLFVVLGVLMLAINVVPGASLAELWPLIIVAVGLVQVLTPDHHGAWGPERIADGLGTVVIGTVLLGCALGYIGWDMWLVLLAMWPVLLVALGFKILGRAVGQSWLTAVGPLFIWAAVFYAAGVAWTGAFGVAALPDPGIHAPVTFIIHGMR